jgi:chromosome segregation ATPase
MEQDKMFNLQLTIQKLQEEVSLYRNGADGDELFQLIAEKENEISGLKASNSVKNDSLKKLAKKSAEVLARCDRLQSDYDTLQFEHSDLIQEKKSLIIQLDVLKSASTRLSTHFEEKKVIVDRLEEELTSRDLSIEKLLGRCAALVSQKNEKQKEFEAETKQFAAERSEKNKQMKELMVNKCFNLFLIVSCIE